VKRTFTFCSEDDCDQVIGSWNISGVTNIEAMLAGATLNEYIGGWNVSCVENKSLIFLDADVIEQDLGC
jgi:hypothetical protein